MTIRNKRSKKYKEEDWDNPVFCSWSTHNPSPFFINKGRLEIGPSILNLFKTDGRIFVIIEIHYLNRL